MKIEIGTYIMKKLITGLVTVAALSGSVMALALFAVTTPDVYVSYSTNECVKVDNYGTDYSCENLPSRYNHVWVQ